MQHGNNSIVALTIIVELKVAPVLWVLSGKYEAQQRSTARVNSAMDQRPAPLANLDTLF